MYLTKFLLSSSLLLILCLPAWANTTQTVSDEETIKNHKAMILKRFASADFTEVEKEKYKGVWVFEYEFTFKGKAYEAFINQQGDILRLGLD